MLCVASRQGHYTGSQAVIWPVAAQASTLSGCAKGYLMPSEQGHHLFRVVCPVASHLRTPLRSAVEKGPLLEALTFLCDCNKRA